MPTLFHVSIAVLREAYRGVTTSRTVEQVRNANPMGRQFKYQPPQKDRHGNNMNSVNIVNVSGSSTWVSELACEDTEGFLIELRRTSTSCGRDYEDSTWLYYITRHGVMCSSMTQDYAEAKWLYTCALMKEWER